MEEKLIEVQEYFKNKIINGDYTITMKSETSKTSPLPSKYCWITVTINDRPFTFSMGSKNSVIQDGELFENYINLGELTEEEQAKIWSRENESR